MTSRCEVRRAWLRAHSPKSSCQTMRRKAAERLAPSGRKVPAADYPLEYNFTEPWGGSGTHGMLVPGPGDAVVDMAGNRLDRTRFTKMLKEYYRLRGWDDETGIPSAETLGSLGLEDVASAILQE